MRVRRARFVRMVSATWHQVRGRRLQRSSLMTRAAAERLVEITSAVGGVHAQIQASAELQLGARVADVTHADIRAALWERRVLVKAWTLRGTLHLHPAEELAVWHAARRAGASTSAQEQLEAWLDAERARWAFQSLGDEIEEVDVEGRRAYVLAGDPTFADAPGTVRLLPEYDLYVMGFRERGELVPDPVRELMARHGCGRYEGPA